MWTAEGRDAEGRPCRDPGSKLRLALGGLGEGGRLRVGVAAGRGLDGGVVADKCIDDLTRNRHRMRYPGFRAAGLCVSSGVVEAGCKLAIGARLKRAGMRWTVAGANAIIALRCCILSGRFEDFWERRAANTA